MRRVKRPALHGCENGDLPDEPELFDKAGVTKSEANKAQIDALLWVEEVV
jgi:EAL and modified HD-GYP domain-containing signal transduction protein